MTIRVRHTALAQKLLALVCSPQAQSFAAAFGLALLLPIAAFAQNAGGGGGVFAQILAWVQGSLVGDLITLAIIGVGLSMLFMRINWMIVLAVCGGGWVILNASTIKGLL